MHRITLTTLLFLAPIATALAEPTHRWVLDAQSIQDAVVKPAIGEMAGKISGPIRFTSTDPKTLILGGDHAAKHGIELSEDIAKALLPTTAITIDVWVKIDRFQDWGGIVGAFQDNGDYEKGFLLGFEKSRFFFAVASKGKKNLTYLHAANHFQTGAWYHLVGTYNGKEQCIYIDGMLQGKATEQRGSIDYPPKGWVTIGSYHDDDEYYATSGQIESVTIHDKALTANDVKQEFAARKKLFPGIEGTRPQVADWPTYNRDNRRTGITEDELRFPLELTWSREAEMPDPAWPDEAKADYYHNAFDIAERVVFDRADHIVGTGNQIYYGSSANGSMTCLDKQTGQMIWSFATEGPVRLAPTIVGDRLVFGSDDGHVYCLRTKDGGLIWKHRIATEDRRIPGNGRIISAWPVRTGVLVEDGKAFVCAGVFPSWGVYQVALSMEDGKELNRQTLKITAQGYLERAFGKLMISTGRDPANAFVAELKQGNKEVGKELNALAKEYPFAFIGTGDVRIAGGDGVIAAFKKDSGEKLWTAKVQGKAYSLAIVQGQLFASTDAGMIYCFSPAGKQTTKPQTWEPVVRIGSLDLTSLASKLIGISKLEKGYILLLGQYSSIELTLIADSLKSCQIVFLEPDAEKARIMRQLLLQKGILQRISIQSGSIEKLPFSDKTFNLVLSEGRTPREEVLRVVKPHGGIALFDRYGKDVVRVGKLEGEGEWTHMYGDPGNTSCSNDQLVGSELQLQWFGKPGPRGMIDRHHRTVPPVSKDGRIFVPGDDIITAVDIYNGTILWEKKVPGSKRVTAFRDSSYLALSDTALYVADSTRCFAFDPATGTELKTFALPKSPTDKKYEWGFTATVGDLLIGSQIQAGGIRREQSNKSTTTTTHWDFVPAVGSDALFAYDRESGKLAWTYQATHGLIANPSLTIADGRIFFVESDNRDTLKEPRAKYAELVGKGSILRCIDLKTGSLLWSQSGELLTPIQHNIFAVHSQGILAIVGSRNVGTNKAKDYLWYDIHTFDAKTGKPIWSKSQNQMDKINGEHGEQERHPTVVGSTIYCEPYAYELKTGKSVAWNWPWSNGKTRRGCGTFSASASSLFYRDDTAKAYDLEAGKPSTVTAETRPGCWINFLPVGGMVVAPEASSGCTCNYSVQTSLGLIPIRKK